MDACVSTGALSERDALLTVHLCTDLRRMGQTTQVARSTVQEVRERIAQLREETAAGATAKAYDFDARIRAIAEEQQREKEARKRKRKEEMQKKKAPPPEEVDEQVMAAMGFGGFGGGKK